MKHLLMASALAVATMSTPTLAADVGVAVTVGQPGFYGRIVIGDYPYSPPQVIYSRPRIVERVYVEREPIYMRVPPGHAKNWKKHCHSYDACGYPVYFVQDSWYEHDYVPKYREYHNDHHDHHYDKDKGNHGHDKKKGNGKHKD